jgi:hypothetical protein
LPKSGGFSRLPIEPLFISGEVTYRGDFIRIDMDLRP